MTDSIKGLFLFVDLIAIERLFLFDQKGHKHSNMGWGMGTGEGQGRGMGTRSGQEPSQGLGGKRK